MEFLKRQDMNTTLIDYFKVALKENNTLSLEDLKELQELSIKSGYIIHPDCWNESVLNWLRTNQTNYNATFYKTWNDVVSKDRLQLLLEQTLSYVINYGLGGNFDMNDHDYSSVPDIHKYTVILPIEKQDLFVKCANVLYSNVALKNSTLKVLCEYIADNYAEYKQLINIDNIQNKEAMVQLRTALNILPENGFDLLRYMVYKCTGDAMLIKNKEKINSIKTCKNGFDMSSMSLNNKKQLATIFFRFKPIILAFKKQYPGNARVVNEIRKMANKYHKPLSVGFWETIVNTPTDETVLLNRLKSDNVSNFKLISLMQTLQENIIISYSTDPYKMYIIRNGGMYVKKANKIDKTLVGWWLSLQRMLYNELVNRLSKKACTVKFPEHLNLACPTSEKNFVGNIPFGSYFNMTNHNMIGIYWKEEWGTQDFDLSFVDYKGHKIGWNGGFYTENVIYSGDMTHADPEASEVIYIKNNCPDGIVLVNRFSGRPNSQYILSVAQSEVNSMPSNYMIDPNTIKFQTTVESGIKKEQVVGFVNDKKLYICDFDRCNSSVSRSGICDYKDYMNIIKRKSESFLDLKMLLLDAGFKEKKRNTKNNPIELDLTKLNKDTLLDLFS